MRWSDSSPGPPQHPVAIPRRQVFAIWAHADTPDASPALRRLSVRLLVCTHRGGAIRVQQGARVAVDVDDSPEILPSCRTST